MIKSVIAAMVIISCTIGAEPAAGGEFLRVDGYWFAKASEGASEMLDEQWRSKLAAEDRACQGGEREVFDAMPERVKGGAQ